MADEKEVDKLLSPFEKMKVQVANHESVIVLRCSIALVNHSINDPLDVKTLFSKVKKHITETEYVKELDWINQFMKFYEPYDET